VQLQAPGLASGAFSSPVPEAKGETRMRKVVVSEYVTVDGVFEGLETDS
jgi:hypothetical protein